MSYDKDFLASLATKASGGTLTDGEVSHLKAAPTGDANYSRALALVAAHYEAKRDYKGHCDASKQVLAQSRWKYSPDWNLEAAKCNLRNGDLEGAVRAAETAISGQMDLAADSRTKRVLLPVSSAT